MKVFKRLIAIAAAIAVIATIASPAAYANTDGSEIKITDQPDKLILQLGPRWAGVEFELKTDAGVFPVPVVVDSSGILKMDLGGSKTYTLSCLTMAAAIPSPEQPAETPAAPLADPPEVDIELEPVRAKDGVPAGILVMFLIGLIAAASGLLAMKYYKRRRESYDYDDEDDYE